MPSSSQITQDYVYPNRMFLKITIGVVLLWALSQISIALQPVPITLQTMGVMAIGLLYDQKTAVCSVASYLVLGICGLPILANASGGIHHFFGPTGGYLFGFLAAVFVMVHFRKIIVGRDFLSLSFLCLIGTATIFSLGIAYLSFFVGVKEAFKLGFMPFIIPGLIKTVLLSFIVFYFKRSDVNPPSCQEDDMN